MVLVMVRLVVIPLSNRSTAMWTPAASLLPLLPHQSPMSMHLW
jgi:hypothetical protein